MAEESEPVSPNAAAVKIQKTYRGYRARRKLADAAIMAKTFGWCVPASSTIMTNRGFSFLVYSVGGTSADGSPAKCLG